MYRSRLTPGRLLLFVLPLILLYLTACVPKLTPNLSHQGQLLNENGSPVADGDYEIVYSIFQAATGGTAVYSETDTVTVENGMFTNSLGLTTTIDPTIFAQPTWLELTVDGETLVPRQRLQGSPFAFSLVSGAVVQGAQTIDRTYIGQEDTGATLTVLNNDASATGGHGLLAINQSTAAGPDRDKTAALQARAVGGNTAANTGAYGLITTSNGYRGMYAKGAPTRFAAVFDTDTGILITGGGTCGGCALMYYGVNSGDSPIVAGDFVAVEGVELDADLNIPVMRVRKATSPSDAVIGVAAGAATRTEVGEYNGVRTGGFDGAAGPAAAGDYLAVVVQGLVQARAADAGLTPGAMVGVSADGVVAAPSGGVTRALSAVDGNGMVWVMLSGQ